MPRLMKLPQSRLPRISSLVALLALAAGLRADEPVNLGPVTDIQAMPANSKKPRGIKQGPPQYPPEMARAGVNGSVAVSFIIDQTGHVQNAYVIRSNNPWFERPALNAVESWRFSPAEVNGHPINVHVTQLIEFNVEPGGDPLDFWRVSKAKDHDKLPPEYRWEEPPYPQMTLFPVYPFELLKAGTPGKASVSYVVGPKGRVVSAKLREATAPEFGAAVLAMIDAWEFSPPKSKDGTKISANLTTEYAFKPGGRADVPVSEEALAILRLLEKKPAEIATLKELDQPMKPRSRRPPVYPTALLAAGQPGEAVIEFYVDKNGDAQLPRIVSSTAPEFGYAAVQAIATWRYDPPKRGGKPAVVRVQIPMGFSVAEHPEGK
jgi:TonB family protein